MSRLSPSFESERDGSEFSTILGLIRGLRDELVTAWRERAVVLSVEEQELLHQEIKRTCRFLSDLTDPS